MSSLCAIGPARGRPCSVALQTDLLLTELCPRAALRAGSFREVRSASTGRARPSIFVCHSTALRDGAERRPTLGIRSDLLNRSVAISACWLAPHRTCWLRARATSRTLRDRLRARRLRQYPLAYPCLGWSGVYEGQASIEVFYNANHQRTSLCSPRDGHRCLDRVQLSNRRGPAGRRRKR